MPDFVVLYCFVCFLKKSKNNIKLYTPQKARNVFVKIQEKKLSDERLTSEKRDIKAQAILLKSNRASLVAQVANISIQGRQEATAIKVRCNNDCGALRKVTPLVTIVPYDKWLGCTI
jgi:hypothetical protein